MIFLRGNSPTVELSRLHYLRLRSVTIAKDQNTFAKRQREMEKKAKAAAKREKRAQRKIDNQVARQTPSGFVVEESDE